MLTKPDTATSETAKDAETLIEVADLQVHFPLRGGLFNRDAGAVKAVDGVSFSLNKGEVLGLVGESGSGKTTLGRTLLGLNRATGGSIRYRGRELAGLKESDLRPLRRKLQMVFQDPHASLNPSMDIATAVGHPLQIHGLVPDPVERRAKVAETLERVGLSPAELFMDKFPSDLSGGQKQRAVMARAIIAGPELLVADEPISMLDMSVRAKILQLFLDLKRDLDLTYVYVTHDLASAKFFCDRIAIMYLGRVVEIGPTEEIFANPRHPYTKALLGAIPDPEKVGVPRDLPRGEIPDAAAPPLGCSFHPRCPVAVAGCGWEGRDLGALLERHWLAEGEDVRVADTALFGRPVELTAPGIRQLSLTPGRGHEAAAIISLLDRVREKTAEDPFWRGVKTIEARDGKAHVEFAEGTDPRLKLVSNTTAPIQAACHLVD
ncbi:ABC transporter ATP-binding protein [Yinghuangia seranimata]|uniref:ABC transporter ATP-binding protein n=1 Tax=Yinghuangia seranimata TaxID=408067 RepID=UPI00248AF6CC|nr:ABC transporter ATP-binding protein [Yinghuangia seranimata]MDI2131572.1 ABC transporter ATP-binding protein [Yinghuangia seranimata]